jgi:bifunctional DNase/RNase
VSATIVAVQDSVFYAQLGFDDGTVIESRASDALAVALRVSCRIWCADAVLEEAGVQLAEGSEEGTEEAAPTPEEEEREMRRFREFLADVEPEDFDE